jgi:hypothetical protein
MLEAIAPLPHTPSWRGAQLRKSTGTTLPFLRFLVLLWSSCTSMYPKVSGLGRLEREMQMVQLSATRCSCIGILWVTIVSFAAINFCVASQECSLLFISLSAQSWNFWIHPRRSCSTLLWLWMVMSDISVGCSTFGDLQISGITVP